MANISTIVDLYIKTTESYDSVMNQININLKEGKKFITLHKPNDELEKNFKGEISINISQIVTVSE